MSRRWLWLLTMLLWLSGVSLAQFTTVNINGLTDPNGTVFQNALISAVFVGESTIPGAGPYLMSGSVFQTTVSGAALNSFGTGTLRLADNNFISPTPSQWEVDFCDQTGKYCGKALITITGQTQDITAILHANAPTLPATGGGGGGGGVSGTVNRLLKVLAGGITGGNSNLQDDGATISVLNSPAIDFSAAASMKFPSTFDASASSVTIPWRKGLLSARPACTVDGQVYFATDVFLGQNLYLCVSTNWQQMRINNDVLNNQSNTFGVGLKQIFQPSATTAGLQLACVTADPSVPAAGDVWCRSDTKLIRFYDGTTVQSLALVGSFAPCGGDVSCSTGTNVIGLHLPATRAGDAIYYNGTAWTELAGNNAGGPNTLWTLMENPSGVPSWSVNLFENTSTHVGGFLGSGGWSVPNGPVSVGTTGGGSLLGSTATLPLANTVGNGQIGIFMGSNGSINTALYGNYAGDGWGPFIRGDLTTGLVDNGQVDVTSTVGNTNSLGNSLQRLADLVPCAGGFNNYDPTQAIGSRWSCSGLTPNTISSTPYTLASTDKLDILRAVAGSGVINLPAPTGAFAPIFGFWLDATQATVAISVSATGGGCAGCLINGLASVTISAGGSAFIYAQDATHWQYMPNTVEGGVDIQTAGIAMAASANGRTEVVNSPSSQTFTLPATPPTPYFHVRFMKYGVGNVVINPNGNTINGSLSNVTISTQYCQAYIFSDGSVYYATDLCPLAGTGITLTGGVGGTTINAAAAVGTLVCSVGPAAAVTGTAAFADLETCNVSAGKMNSATSCINVVAWWHHSSGTVAPSYRWTFGGTTIPAQWNGQTSTTNEQFSQAVICNSGATNTQNTFMMPAFGQLTVLAAANNGTAAIDTTASTTVKIQFNVAATDQVTPDGMMAYVSNP